MIEAEVLPLGVDGHAHGRGLEEAYRQTPEELSTRALLGGTGVVCVMPNNRRGVYTKELLDEVKAYYRPRTSVDVGFYFGTDGQNISEFGKVDGEVVGLKAFMDESTNARSIRDLPRLTQVFKHWPKGTLVAVHAEDIMVYVALGLAGDYDQVLKILHVSRAEEVEAIREAKKRGQKVYAETCPHYLLPDMDSSKSWHPHWQMNPPLNNSEGKKAVLEGVIDGTIDTFGSDHAPHDEVIDKLVANPAKGIPGVQERILLMLKFCEDNGIPMKRAMEMMHFNPIKILGLPEMPIAQNYIKVIKMPNRISSFGHAKVHSPWNGRLVNHLITEVVRRGELAMKDGKVLAEPGSGLILPQAA